MDVPDQHKGVMRLIFSQHMRSKSFLTGRRAELTLIRLDIDRDIGSEIYKLDGLCGEADGGMARAYGAAPRL